MNWLLAWWNERKIRRLHAKLVRELATPRFADDRSADCRVCLDTGWVRNGDRRHFCLCASGDRRLAEHQTNERAQNG